MYIAQCKIVAKIDALFSDPKFDENKKANQEKIFALMQEMQEMDSPPESLLAEVGMGSQAPSQAPAPECAQM